MGKATFNGVSINYRCMGQGRDVVLIHGLGASQGFWGPRILLPLARAYRVTLIDLRGHGYSDMPAHGYTTTDFATDLYHLLDLLHIQQVDLIGHSFGGTVALQAAVLFPERIRSLVLADTRVRSLQSNNFAGAMRESCVITKKLEQIGLSIPKDEEEAGLWLLEKFASSLHAETLKKLKDTEPFIPFVTKKGKSRSSERLLKLFQTTSAKDEISKSVELTREKLSHIKQPTLAMCGESLLTKESLLGLQQNLGHCHTVIFSEAGHFFPLTHSKLFVKTVMEFLDKVGLSEFREYERYLLKIPVQLCVKGREPFPALTANVSQRGLLVQSPQKVDLGLTIQIMIMLESGGPQIALQAKVVRVVKERNENIYRLGLNLLSTDENLKVGRFIHRQSAI